MAPNCPRKTGPGVKESGSPPISGFHYEHPFAPLVIGALSRAPEVLDVETAFTNRQLAAGALLLQAARRDGIIPGDIDPISPSR